MNTIVTGTHSAIKLKNLYKRTRRILQKIPREAPYRINTEAIICHRLTIVDEAGDDVKEIEDNIGGGNIGTLISQAEAEFGLVQKMILWKSWEEPKEEPPQWQWDWPPVNV